MAKVIYPIKKQSSKLKLKHKFYYIEYITNNKIYFLPRRHEYFYREFWTGYIDFLGCESYRSSYGERRIKEFLIDNKIEFIQEKRFDTCRFTLELPFDFFLPEYNLCIEYDGEHHFHVVSKYGGIEYLEKVKRNDDIKNKWCLYNNVSLLRISYKEKGKIFDILNEKISLSL